jgi:hypothetical protein
VCASLYVAAHAENKQLDAAAFITWRTSRSVLSPWLSCATKLQNQFKISKLTKVQPTLAAKTLGSSSWTNRPRTVVVVDLKISKWRRVKMFSRRPWRLQL